MQNKPDLVEETVHFYYYKTFNKKTQDPNC